MRLAFVRQRARCCRALSFLAFFFAFFLATNFVADGGSDERTFATGAPFRLGVSVVPGPAAEVVGAVPHPTLRSTLWPRSIISESVDRTLPLPSSQVSVYASLWPVVISCVIAYGASLSVYWSETAVKSSTCASYVPGSGRLRSTCSWPVGPADEPTWSPTEPSGLTL